MRNRPVENGDSQISAHRTCQCQCCLRCARPTHFPFQWARFGPFPQDSSTFTSERLPTELDFSQNPSDPPPCPSQTVPCIAALFLLWRIVSLNASLSFTASQTYLLPILFHRVECMWFATKSHVLLFGFTRPRRVLLHVHLSNAPDPIFMPSSASSRGAPPRGARATR